MSPPLITRTKLKRKKPKKIYMSTVPLEVNLSPEILRIQYITIFLKIYIYVFDNIFSCATYNFITRLMKTLLQIIKPLKYIFYRYKYKFLGVIKAKNLIIIKLKVIFKKIILSKNIKQAPIVNIVL